MPITIKRKEFVMPYRDWLIKSNLEQLAFLSSMGFDIFKTQINRVEGNLIKFFQDFEEEINITPYFYESKFEPKEETIKGLQVIKFPTE